MSAIPQIPDPQRMPRAPIEVREPAPEVRSNPVRIMLYSHDTYGLGHLRRNLLLCDRFAAVAQAPQVLLATGSPRAQAFELPEGCDTFKLPTVLKQPDGTYRSRTLGVPFEEMREMRSQMLLAAYRSFRPDVVLVDHAPAGCEGEILPLLREVRSGGKRPRMVLGLRDVIDEPGRVRSEWRRLGVWDELGDLYDHVLVYGDLRVPTTASELGLESRLPGKVVHTGYLGRPVPPYCPVAHRDTEPMILVTAGGGGDGHKLFRAYASFLESLEAPAPFRSVVVTGPFLSRERYAEISGRLRATVQRVAVFRFTAKMESLLASAAGVVAMGGYNSVVEILAAGSPALIVPRTEPRREQVLRARRLAPHCGFEICPGDRIDGETIGKFVRRILDERPPRRVPELNLGGLDRVASEVLDCTGRGAARTTPTDIHGRGARHAGSE